MCLALGTPVVLFVEVRGGGSRVAEVRPGGSDASSAVANLRSDVFVFTGVDGVGGLGAARFGASGVCAALELERTGYGEATEVDAVLRQSDEAVAVRSLAEQATSEGQSSSGQGGGGCMVDGGGDAGVNADGVGAREDDHAFAAVVVDAVGGSCDAEMAKLEFGDVDFGLSCVHGI